MRFIKAAIIPMVLAMLFAVCAKKPATIKGRVTDADGRALAGAGVFTVPQQQSTLTDSAGFFIFEEVPPGEYSLLAKYDTDSTVKQLGPIRPGETVTYDMVIFLAPPPPPPPPPEPPPDTTAKVEAPPPKPKEPGPVTDPALKTGANVLHLGTSEYLKKYRVESSDDLVWELRNEKDSKLKFKGGRLLEGYFSGPYHKYWETAARRLEYNGKVWIYIHGPESVVDGSRSITIGIPLGLPSEAEIDSIVLEYGLPRFPEEYSPGGVQLRLLGETASDITDLMDWKRIDHAENGLVKKQVIIPRGANRKLVSIGIETDSDGDASWDALMVRPLIYYGMY